MTENKLFNKIEIELEKIRPFFPHIAILTVFITIILRNGLNNVFNSPIQFLSNLVILLFFFIAVGVFLSILLIMFYKILEGTIQINFQKSVLRNFIEFIYLAFFYFFFGSLISNAILLNLPIRDSQVSNLDSTLMTISTLSFLLFLRISKYTKEMANFAQQIFGLFFGIFALGIIEALRNGGQFYKFAFNQDLNNLTFIVLVLDLFLTIFVLKNQNPIINKEKEKKALPNKPFKIKFIDVVHSFYHILEEIIPIIVIISAYGVLFVNLKFIEFAGYFLLLLFLIIILTISFAILYDEKNRKPLIYYTVIFLTSIVTLQTALVPLISPRFEYTETPVIGNIRIIGNSVINSQLTSDIEITTRLPLFYLPLGLNCGKIPFSYKNPAQIFYRDYSLAVDFNETRDTRFIEGCANIPAFNVDKVKTKLRAQHDGPLQNSGQCIEFAQRLDKYTMLPEMVEKNAIIGARLGIFDYNNEKYTVTSTTTFEFRKTSNSTVAYYPYCYQTSNDMENLLSEILNKTGCISVQRLGEKNSWALPISNNSDLNYSFLALSTKSISDSIFISLPEFYLPSNFSDRFSIDIYAFETTPKTLMNCDELQVGVNVYK